jgi:hypothetical protein
MLYSFSVCSGSRFFLRIVLVLSFLALGGCAGKYAERDSERLVTVEGTLSLRGSTPFPILLLSSGRKTFLVRSDSLYEELKNLQGMQVRLQGEKASAPSLGLPVLNAESYELLPLSGGEAPLVGVLLVQDAACFLIPADGETIELRGNLVELLKGFAGGKVWVVGKRSPEGMDVEGYGLILRGPGGTFEKKRLEDDG